MDRRLATILAMDIVGYSRLMEADEEGTLNRLKDLRQNIVLPCIERYRGRVVKTMGDGALVEFASVVAALQCAIEIQAESEKRAAGHAGGDKLHFRIGLHLGDVIIEGEDIYGDGVNVAARLESMAEPGGIVLSKQVHDHIGSNVRADFVSLGEQTVKNISRPIHAYRVEARGIVADPVIRFGRFELDTKQFELRDDGAKVAVEPQVFDLLVFLARNAGRTVTKEEIFAAIWGDRIVSDSALSSQIKAARRAVGDDGASQHTIGTVHGRGFRFMAPIAAAAADATAPAADTEQAPGARRPTLALLPFVNLNRDSNEDYLASGLCEDITTLMAKHRWLSVVARNSAFSFKDSREGLQAIGQKLCADYLVTGNLRRAGTRFRITVEVVETAGETVLWSERFDRDSVDVFDLQDEISTLVAARIAAELGVTEQRRVERHVRRNLGAWDHYQLGLAEFYKFSAEANALAQQHLRRSIALDPNFASAYSRLAYTIVLSMIYFDAPVDEARLADALALARKSIELDDQDANGFFSLGRTHLARGENTEAMEALRHAIDLNPSLAVSYCGLGDSLAYEGRLDDALAQFERAVRLSAHDPQRWSYYSYRSLCHIFRREFADAAVWARRAAQLPNAQYWAHAHLVSALGHLGDLEQAMGAIADLLRIKPNFTRDYAKSRLFYLKNPAQLALYTDGLRRAGMS